MAAPEKSSVRRGRGQSSEHPIGATTSWTVMAGPRRTQLKTLALPLAGEGLVSNLEQTAPLAGVLRRLRAVFVSPLAKVND
jgi:hypothetical protein